MPLGAILPLGHRLNPDTKVLLVCEPETMKLPEISSNIFFYHPSDRLKAVLARQNIKPERVYQFQDDTLTLSLYQFPVS